MNAVFSETIKAIMLGLSEQILKILRQRKLISVKFHAYSNARKPPKTVAPPVLMLD